MTFWDFAHEHWFALGLFSFASLFTVLLFAEAWQARSLAARIAIAAAKKGKNDE